MAEKGGGAVVNGTLISRPSPPRDAARLRGAALTSYMDAVLAERVRRRASLLGQVTRGRMCAGSDYPALARGEQDFVLFWRTLPWDHAPGVLLVEEVGAMAARPGGGPYRPTDDSKGLLVAADRPTWATVHELLMGVDDPPGVPNR